MHSQLRFRPAADKSHSASLGSLFDNMPDRLIHVFEDLVVGCQILDHELRYQYLNVQAAAHGRRQRDDLLGRRMIDAYPGIEDTELFARISHCLHTGQADRFDNEFQYEDGTIGIFELSIQGIPGGVLIASIDVTQERQLAQRLLQMQKLEAIGRLAGGVAHDFNNLLTVIRGHCDLLRAGLPVQQQQESIASILSAGERASRLTRQLLSISRHAEIHPELLDLRQQWEKSEDFIRSLLGAGSTLQVEFDSALPAIEADAGQFEQTLMNLALNARDAMPGGGTLGFHFQSFQLDEPGHPLVPEMPAGSYVCLRVKDTGIGIPEEIQGRIFDPFYTTKEEGRGTGLGLAIVQGAVRQAAGYIAVTSRPDQGATFHLFYPAVPKSRLMQPQNGSTPSVNKKRILLVEDEDSVRRIVKLSLETKGCEVLECSHPENALGMLDRVGTIDLLVTDVVMPNLRGPELAHLLRELLPDLRVLYMSGYADESIGLKNALRPSDDFLQKPFSPSELVRRVQQLLSK